MRPTHEGWYHVTGRSIAEEHIFRDDRDYLAGIQILAELVREGFFAVRGFCLMPTHYHLFAWFEDSKLTAGRQRLNRRYAGGFNRRHQRRGHVFDVPFTSVHIENHEHFEWLDEYIASNPARRPWPWSSYDSEFSFATRESSSLGEIDSGG